MSFGRSECNRVKSKEFLVALSAIGLSLMSFGRSECNRVKSKEFLVALSAIGLSQRSFWLL